MAEENTGHTEWICVLSSTDMFRIEVSRARLEEAGIMAVVVNKRDSAYHFGEIELHVEKKDVIMALHELAKQHDDE